MKRKLTNCNAGLEKWLHEGKGSMQIHCSCSIFIHTLFVSSFPTGALDPDKRVPHDEAVRRDLDPLLRLDAGWPRHLRNLRMVQ